MLPDYERHFVRNPGSLIAKIYGVFTLESSLVRKVHVMLMANSIQPNFDGEIVKTFDLKGSTVDRESKNFSGVLKDVNLMKLLQRDSNLVDLLDSEKKRLRKIIKNDV
jgi:ethanolamine utilization protein EutA (predicted chaperonin)